MTNNASPVITSLLDTDAYKLHMQQAVFHHYYDVNVTAEFRCRSGEQLGFCAEEIAASVRMMETLALSEEEYRYLASMPFFKTGYLNWLRDFRFNPGQVEIRNHSGDLAIRINGPWREVIMWEVPLLALISETVHRHKSPHITSAMAVEQLHKRLAHFASLTANDEMSDFHVMDFGTRRRFSRQVQYAIAETLHREVPWLSGTSNYDLARRLSIAPRGTQAHEWFQAHQQLSHTLADSQRVALQTWLDEYDHHLAIALTDCISMDAFLRDFGIDFAHSYQGLRHDSGDPVQWGEKAIAHYQQLGIDPQSKTLVFSDNLNLEKALHLYRHFSRRTRVAFGIGTQLTCDIPGVKPLNIVIKLTECNGKPVAKLSDSPGKTICHDQEFVSQLRKAFDVPFIREAC